MAERRGLVLIFYGQLLAGLGEAEEALNCDSGWGYLRLSTWRFSNPSNWTIRRHRRPTPIDHRRGIGSSTFTHD